MKERDEVGTERGEWGLQTRLIHAPEEANDTPAVAPPVYQTSTFRLFGHGRDRP